MAFVRVHKCLLDNKDFDVVELLKKDFADVRFLDDEFDLNGVKRIYVKDESFEEMEQIDVTYKREDDGTINLIEKTRYK